jgi:hypothetical protein
VKYTILFNFYFVLSPFLVVISENWGYYDLYSFLGMDSFGDLLHLLRSYFKDDYLPTKILEFQHNTVKVVIYSQIDTCARLRVSKRNRGFTDRLIYLSKGLNALCLCNTFPSSHVEPVTMTRMKVKKRYMSGVTVKLFLGHIQVNDYYFSDRVIEERFMKAVTFEHMFLRRVASDNELVEKVVIELNNSVQSLQSLSLREAALIGLDFRPFIKIIRGKVAIQIQKDYKKYCWSWHMIRFLNTIGLTNDNYMEYRDNCWDDYQSNGHHRPVNSSSLTFY